MEKYPLILGDMLIRKVKLLLVLQAVTSREIATKCRNDKSHFYSNEP